MRQGEDYTSVGPKDSTKVKTSESKEKSFARVLKSFTRIKDNLKGEEVDINLLEDLLTSEDLDSEIDKVSVGFMLMSSMAAWAEERYENQKARIRYHEAELDEKARDGNITARVTDAKVRAWINRDSKFQKLTIQLNKYKKQMQIYEAAARAYDIKSRMLQTKSANIRKITDLPNDNMSKTNAYDKVSGKKPRG